MKPNGYYPTPPIYPEDKRSFASWLLFIRLRTETENKFKQYFKPPISHQASVSSLNKITIRNGIFDK